MTVVSPTVGVLQTTDGLRRVARECAEDLAADGIVYAEVRFAPELHLDGGLTLDHVPGSYTPPATGTTINCAMRSPGAIS